MEPTNTAVETNENLAANSQTGVKTTDSHAPENDPEAKIATLIAENERLANDRDNYRKGMLAAKGKIETEDLDLSDPTQLASYVKKQVDEQLNASKYDQSREELTNYAKELARKNKELALALQNRTGMTSTGQGSGASSKTSYFSEDQLAEFKKRGWSDEKIKLAETNMRKSGK